MAEVRERVAADLPGCVDALREVRAAVAYPARWPVDPVAFLAPPDLGAWIAEHDAAIVGHAVVLRDVPAGIAEHADVPAGCVAAVGRLFTTPAGRGLGLGAALLAAAVQRIRALGRTPVLDVVASSAPAIALYERTGWRHIGGGPARWTDPDGSHPLVRYYVLPDPAAEDVA